jgi:hypothetical protein
MVPKGLIEPSIQPLWEADGKGFTLGDSNIMAASAVALSGVSLEALAPEEFQVIKKVLDIILIKWF